MVDEADIEKEVVKMKRKKVDGTRVEMPQSVDKLSPSIRPRGHQNIRTSPGL